MGTRCRARGARLGQPVARLDRASIAHRSASPGGGEAAQFDLASGAPYKGRRGYVFPYGDYLAIAVDDQGDNHVIWGEGASWNGPGGTWYTRGQ